jgi:hypothetical protein
MAIYYLYTRRLINPSVDNRQQLNESGFTSSLDKKLAYVNPLKTP